MAPKKPLTDRIAEAEEKLKKLKAAKQRLESVQRARETKLKRQQDTRRKILVGAVVLANVDMGKFPEVELLDMLNKGLTKPTDRELFNLPPLTPTPNPAPEGGEARAAGQARGADPQAHQPPAASVFPG